MAAKALQRIADANGRGLDDETEALGREVLAEAALLCARRFLARLIRTSIALALTPVLTELIFDQVVVWVMVGAFEGGTGWIANRHRAEWFPVVR